MPQFAHLWALPLLNYIHLLIKSVEIWHSSESCRLGTCDVTYQVYNADIYIEASKISLNYFLDKWRTSLSKFLP
jgi:hypothetical protein